MSGCVFCQIAAGDLQATKVYEDDFLLAFLDIRPLFHGHTLVVPKQHIETLVDLPAELIQPLFTLAQALSAIMPRALGCEGTFVAANNKVSQSVPHLHVHVVPRTKGDGLKGFFWPRVKYESEKQMEAVASKIRAGLYAE